MTLSIMLMLIVVILLQIHMCISISLRDEMLLTDKQKEGFDRFKAKAVPLITTPYMTNDIVLIKYYKASGMDETKAMDRMRDNLKWRLDMGFESLTEDELNEYSRNYPYSTLVDKMGRGVFFFPGKYWDVENATKTPQSIQKFTQYAYHLIEDAYAKGVSNIAGKTASGIVFFEDIYGIDMAKSYCVPCGSMTKDIMSQIDIRWPGGLQLAILVNAKPMLVPGINLFKNGLPENLQKVVFVYDEDDKVWMPEVLKFLRKDQLPAELYVQSQSNPQPKFGSVGGSTPGLGALFSGGGSGGSGIGGMGGGGGMSDMRMGADDKKQDGRGMTKPKKDKNQNKKKKLDDDDDDDD